MKARPKEKPSPIRIVPSEWPTYFWITDDEGHELGSMHICDPTLARRIAEKMGWPMHEAAGDLPEPRQ
jgi:hypothetical protein